jgi:hypothetical protein
LQPQHTSDQCIPRSDMHCTACRKVIPMGGALTPEGDLTLGCVALVRDECCIVKAVAVRAAGQQRHSGAPGHLHRHTSNPLTRSNAHTHLKTLLRNGVLDNVK